MNSMNNKSMARFCMVALGFFQLVGVASAAELKDFEGSWRGVQTPAEQPNNARDYDVTIDIWKEGESWQGRFTLLSQILPMQSLAVNEDKLSFNVFNVTKQRIDGVATLKAGKEKAIVLQLNSADMGLVSSEKDAVRLGWNPVSKGAALADADLSGRYDGEVGHLGGKGGILQPEPMPLYVELKVEGDEVGGSVVINRKEFPLKLVQRNGNRIYLEWAGEKDSVGRLVADATADGLEGDLSAVPSGWGKFKLKKIKKGG